MDRSRVAIIEKAREKRNRKKEAHRAASTSEPAEGIAETLKEVTQGVIEAVGAIVKTTTQKLKTVVS